jgi:hypothetical protein
MPNGADIAAGDNRPAAGHQPYQWSPFSLNNIHFSGEDDGVNLEWDRFHSFLKQVTNTDDLTDEYKKFVLLKMLKGRAMQFYLDQPEFPTSTYRHVETVMAAEFASKKRTTTAKLQEIVQKAKEPVKEYYNRFMRAARPATDDDDGGVGLNEVERQLRKDAKLKVLGEFAVQFFINGLRSDLRNAVFQARADNLDKALEVAKAQEEYIENFGTSMAKPHFSVSTVSDDISASLNNLNLRDTDATIRDARSILRNLAASDHRNDKNSSRGDFSKNSFSRRNDRSSRDYSNHSSRSPSRDRHVTFRDSSPRRPRPDYDRSRRDSHFSARSSTNRNITCFYCKKVGHMKNECRARKAASPRRYSHPHNHSYPIYRSPARNNVPRSSYSPSRHYNHPANDTYSNSQQNDYFAASRDPSTERHAYPNNEQRRVPPNDRRNHSHSRSPSTERLISKNGPQLQ